MKIRFLTLLVVIVSTLIASITCHAQLVCDTVFMKEYRGTGDIEPFTTKYLSGNEILIAGKASLSLNGSYQLMVTKLSSKGAVIWSNLLGGSDGDKINGIVLLADNSYLLYGVASSFGYSGGKVLLIRLAADGSVIWSRQMGDASTSKDIIKDVKQAADGDILATFNMNDSTSMSDPVVFKMDLNGTLRWTRKFENAGDDSFTSLAEWNNKIYVSGFSTNTRKHAAITILNSVDGSLVSTQSPYYSDTSYNQEIAGLEVYNGKMSYGLWSKKIVSGNPLSSVLLIQSDLSGVKTFETRATLEGNPDAEIFKRTSDNGFFVMRLGGTAPAIAKLNSFNTIEWSTVLSNLPYYLNQQNHGFDITSANGIISAGYYRSFNNGNLKSMVVAKTSENGIAGGCTQRGNTFFTDTVTLRQGSFLWPVISQSQLSLNQTISLSLSTLSLTKYDLCDTSLCKEITPLPLPCNKTSLVEYEGYGYSVFRDAITMPDGGKIAVGEFSNQGFITRIGNNGDIIWSKKYDEFSHNMIFMRVIKSDGGNVLAFANNYYTINHGASRTVKVIKLDGNGNILFSKEIIRGNYFEMADVFATADGGFVIMLNESYGAGYLYSDVIRFDSNLNVIWKKEIKHFSAAPIYRSIFCSGNAVYIGHDSYDSNNQNKVGIQKLDYATGNNVWSKGFTIDADMLRFNKIIVVNDTVYAFINKLKQIDWNNYDFRIVMMKLNAGGDIQMSRTLNTDSLVWPSTYYYIDYSNPTVTYTPDNNFVTSNRVKLGSNKGLNITRFDKEGNGLWSKNYSQLNSHTTFNIHTQDSGIVIMGTVGRPRTIYPSFTNSFLLKTDNQGEILSTASGMCLPESRPFSNSPITINEVPSRVDSVVNLIPFSVIPSNINIEPVAFDATLFCNQIAYCSTVIITGDTVSCQLQDTLKFYPVTNNCGALIRWSYDTAYFSFVSKSGDTIRLSPKQPGLANIQAHIETPCFDSVQNLSVSILLEAADIYIGLDTILCNGDSITLHARPGYNSYLWNNGSTDSLLLVTIPGIYYVTVTDFCGGTGVDSIFINGIANTFDLTGPTEKCNNDTLVLTATTGFSQYQWLPAQNINAINNIAAVYPTQTTQYYVQAMNNAGCSVNDSLLITVKTSPPITLGNDTTICYNESVQLSVPAGFNNYQWSNGNQSQSTIAVPGIYSISATYFNGCVSKDTVVVQQYSFTYPALGNDASLCDGQRLSPGNYQSYLWNDLSSNSYQAVSSAGSYWVEVTDINGCKASDTISVQNIFANPSGFLKQTDTLCSFDKLVIVPSETFKNYSWSTGSSQLTITVDKGGLYSLTVTDANNCPGRDTIEVVEKSCLTGVFIPTAFTPNGDYLNDIFRARVYGIPLSFSLQVFDRWGNLVFQTTDASKGWDGKVNGTQAASAVFVWQCSYQLQGASATYQKGTVALIR